MAVVGEGPFLVGFELVGAEGYEARTAEEARDRVRELIESGKYGLIILPERFVEATRELRERILREGKVGPLFVFLPDHTGVKGKRVEELKEKLALAIGAKLKL